MKKAIILSLFLLLTIATVFAVGNPRTFYQEVVSGNGVDIRTIVTNTGNTTNANYLVTVDNLSSVGEVLATGATAATNLRLVKLGTAPNDYVSVYLQLSTFPVTPWQVGDVLRWTVTYTGAGIYNGQSTTWDTTIPAGTGLISYRAPNSKTIPPLAVVDPNPTTATYVAPANNAVNVPVAGQTLSWTYTPDAGYTNPAGYKVYFGAGSLPATFTYTTETSFAIPAMEYSTTYFWKVVPTTEAGKAMTRGKVTTTTTSRAAVQNNVKGDATGAATWSFTTEAAPITDHLVTINSNIAGVKIFMDGVLQTTNPVSVADGANVTFVVQHVPTMITPLPQNVTVNGPMTLTFTYTSIPEVGVTFGSTLVDEADVTAALPITVPAAGGFNFTFTPQAAGLVVFTVIEPNSAKINSNTYAGYQHVWQVFQVYTDDTNTLNGTNVSIQYVNDLPYEVAVNWGAWYPQAGPWSGYLFNNGPATSLSLPLSSFGAGSSYVNGATNTLTVGPLPTIPAGAYTLELVLNDGDHTLPVTLTSFTAVATAQMFVNLQWVTASENNNLGFNVLRSTTSDVNTAEQVNVNMIAGTNSEVQHSYNFVDNDVVAGETYYYWLESVSLSGTSQFSTSIIVRMDAPTVTPVPTVTTISKAYPNPFSMNHSTRMNVEVKANENATVTVYNILGQAVQTWSLNTGSHKIEWNGRDSKGNALGCGVYFAKMTSPTSNKTVKMVIVK